MTDTAAAANPLPRTPWRDMAYGVVAGLLLGYAASIRYTSALLLLPILAAIGFRLWHDRASLRATLPSVGGMLAAYALTPIGLMLYNHRLFGSPFRTGYSLSGEQGAFGWSHLVDAHRILFLGLYDLAPVVLGLAAVGLLVAGRPRDRVLRALFILPLYALYASYYWAPNNSSYYRFLICVMPFMAGCAMACIDQSTSRWRGVAALALAGLVAYQHWPALSQQFEGKTYPHGSVAAAVHKAQHETPGDTVLFVSDELSYHLAAVADQRVYSMGAFRPGRAWWPYREKWAPRMQPIRKNQMEELYKNVNGDWLIAKRNRMISGFLAASRPVAFVVPANDAESVKRSLDLDLVASVRDTWLAVEDQKWVILEVERR